MPYTLKNDDLNEDLEYTLQWYTLEEDDDETEEDEEEDDDE